MLTSGLRRREFLAAGATSAAGALFGPAFLKQALAATKTPGLSPYGPLLPPDANGLMLPAGFTGRELARGGDPIGGYVWHFASDGQATYRTLDGGHVLVSNSETPAPLGGGSSAIKFGPDGEVERAYRILSGTNLNCGGGPTPWGTWLSGEEHPGGMIWEADPAGILPEQPRPALGNFPHEAAAVDPVHKHVYLTEDQGDGCFYRFTPDHYPNLNSGTLEAAVVDVVGRVRWSEVPDPNIVFGQAETRNQVPGATRFDGGEGVWYDDGTVWFTTKGDKRVWAYDTNSRILEVVYDGRGAPAESLNAVDNVTVAASGDVYVCEDGGNMEIGIITPDRVVAPFVRMVGAQHEGSEMVGVVFDPSGKRMYFGSQRSYPIVGGTPAAHGAVYEVTGPFRLPRGGVPGRKVYGPPAGEVAGIGIPDAGAELGLRSADSAVLGRGLTARIDLPEAAEVRAVVRTAALQTIETPRWHDPRPVMTTLAATRATLGKGENELRLLGRRPLAAGVPAVLLVEARSRRGRRRVAAKMIRVR